MATPEEAAPHPCFTATDCFDLKPERIDRARFAALDVDLALGSEEAERIASDFLRLELGLRRSA